MKIQLRADSKGGGQVTLNGDGLSALVEAVGEIQKRRAARTNRADVTAFEIELSLSDSKIDYRVLEVLGSGTVAPK